MRFKRSLIPLTLAALAAVASINVASANIAGSFPDTNKHWAESSIILAANKGYIDGYPDGSFRPEEKVTRSEFVKMVVSALKLPIQSDGNTKKWYTSYFDSAIKGVIYVPGDFIQEGMEDEPITRKEMACIAVRAIGQSTDDSRKWMYLAAKSGIITGLSAGELGADETTTRAQAVTVIERILNTKSGHNQKVDKYAVSQAEIYWHGTNLYTKWPRYFNPKDADKFDLGKAKWDSADGIYHEEVTEFIVVDMEDPNDPYLDEIKDMPFSFRAWDSDGKPLPGKEHLAPTKSYVTFSKVKQVIYGQYPKELHVAPGGGISVSKIVPKDAVENGRKDWRAYYSSQESPDSIYFTKDTEGQSYVQWNIDRGNNPYYVSNIPNDGGTFYWVKAQVHPKGDMYSWNGSKNYLTYLPDVAYMKTYGPPHDDGMIITGISNYTVQNPGWE